MSHISTDIIKNPSFLPCENHDERLMLVFHPPVFVLKVCDAIHAQIARCISIFIPIERYYFIAYGLIPTVEHAYVKAGERAPPVREV